MLKSPSRIMVMMHLIQPFSLELGRRVSLNNLMKGICMKKISIILVLIIGLMLPRFLLAQGTLYVSNLEQTPTGRGAVESDSWIAQTFITGTNSGGYALNSVQLLMDAASGSPRGSPSGFAVSIYSSLSTEPASNLANLVGSDPSGGGIYTYTASDLRQI